jgi:RimJ/RimL family protein N-acetyltransferase
VAAPVIETARLRLRGHRAEDLADRMRMTGDAEVMRFIGGQAQSREENWARIQRYAGQWALMGWGLFALERDGCFVGEAGLSRFERGLGPDFDHAPEAAWLLARDASGRGLAREAMDAAIGWHEVRFGPTRMVCVIGRDNAASLRLATRLGFLPFRNTRYREQPVLLLERLPLAPAAEAR